MCVFLLSSIQRLLIIKTPIFDKILNDFFVLQNSFMKFSVLYESNLEPMESMNFTKFAFYPNMNNKDARSRIRNQMLHQYDHCQGAWSNGKVNIQMGGFFNLKSNNPVLSCLFNKGSAHFAREFINTRFRTGFIA